ncbi:AraC family transcriptional regulator [Pseudomonas oryzihabitans]|uniref:AraC family transcriptional regulator n=1 Tax=Pseudomonas oryzihabitans TaxID=47885 RepID=UPI001CC300B1|nr:AraC family transcriptional regulator [Pseudomonas oryzihabitans]
MSSSSMLHARALDAETYQLVDMLKEALDNACASETRRLLEAGRELCGHLLQHYARPEEDAQARIPLAPWQERKAKELLSKDHGESSRLMIAEVAKSCSLSRSHFSRAFKKATGVSPQEWALSCRIDKAKGLLAQTDMSVAYVALECGFSDQSHFCRTFAKLAGQTPRRWRSMQQDGMHAADVIPTDTIRAAS